MTIDSPPETTNWTGAVLKHGESPNTVHGRLMESVHIAGYSVKRAVDEFQWLLDDDRWRQVGPGFESINDFLATIKLDEFRLEIDQRKELAKRLAKLQASQRATAQALGVGKGSIARDLAPSGPSGAHPAPEHVQERDDLAPSGPSGAEPEWFQEDIDPAKLAKGRSDRKKRDADAEQRRIDEDRRRSQGGPTEATVDIREGDFRDVLAHLRDVDAIITDPPYPAEYLPLLDDLAAWADKVLAGDGVMAILMGQTHLPDVYRRLEGGRPYRWTACLLTPGAGYVSMPRRLQSNWKPVLIYGGGPRFSDVIRSDGDSGKEHHRWGQDFAGFSTLVERLTEPGQTVVDPFVGSGTTLLAAHALGRHAVGTDIDAESVATARKRLNG